MSDAVGVELSPRATRVLERLRAAGASPDAIGTMRMDWLATVRPTDSKRGRHAVTALCLGRLLSDPLLSTRVRIAALDELRVVAELLAADAARPGRTE